jgi:hypothetical protein
VMLKSGTSENVKDRANWNIETINPTCVE